MKLASLRGGRDGRLALVDRGLTRIAAVPQIAPTLQAALDDWAATLPKLREAAAALEQGKLDGAVAYDPALLAAPLPRAYQWVDGSAYVNHVELVRKARGAEMPPSFWTDPLMYQGGSDSLLGPTDPVAVADEAYGIDFESEIAVITDDVPMGVSAANAGRHIQLVLLVNDVSLRNLIPAELAKGFGFFHAKPSSAFSPVAVSPDELGDAWNGGSLDLALRSYRSGALFGTPNGRADMIFDFPTLIAHAAKTRPLVAGTIVGSGTVSNKGQDGGPGRPVGDGGVGYACIAEIRTVETIRDGKPATEFLKFGERVKIEMLDAAGKSIFGAIDQEIVRYQNPG